MGLIRVHMGRMLCNDVMSVFQKYDMTLPQMVTLDVLLAGPQSVSGISEALRVTKGAASRMIDNMVNKGLVRREVCNGDRRARMLSVTPLGIRVFRLLEKSRTDNLMAALSGLDIHLLEELGDVLARVRTAIEKGK